MIGSYVSLNSQLTFHCNVHSKIVGFGVLEESSEGCHWNLDFWVQAKKEEAVSSTA